MRGGHPSSLSAAGKKMPAGQLTLHRCGTISVIHPVIKSSVRPYAIAPVAQTNVTNYQLFRIVRERD
jgi:hypothetical protein